MLYRGSKPGDVERGRKDRARRSGSRYEDHVSDTVLMWRFR